VYPDFSQAPSVLQILEGNCGPMSAWLVLKYFNKRMSVKSILKHSKHTRKDGVYTIGLAIALKVAGLKVVFHTDEDENISPSESKLYDEASKLGIEVCPAISIKKLLSFTCTGHAAIVYYEITKGIGHFSPVISSSNNQLFLLYSNEQKMTEKEFSTKWNTQNACRQCIIAAQY
jgi:hypothetical protein